MQILNTIHHQIDNTRLYELVSWVRAEQGNPTVKSISFNNKADNYQYTGTANQRTKEIKINIGKRLLSMRYRRVITGGRTVLIDPCGIEETVIVSAAHEMAHLKLRGTFHKQVHEREYEALQEWRKLHPSSSVKRFVYAIITFFLMKMD